MERDNQVVALLEENWESDEISSENCSSSTSSSNDENPETLFDQLVKAREKFFKGKREKGKLTEEIVNICRQVENAYWYKEKKIQQDISNLAKLALRDAVDQVNGGVCGLGETELLSLLPKQASSNFRQWIFRLVNYRLTKMCDPKMLKNDAFRTQRFVHVNAMIEIVFSNETLVQNQLKIDFDRAKDIRNRIRPFPPPAVSKKRKKKDKGKEKKEEDNKRARTPEFLSHPPLPTKEQIGECSQDVVAVDETEAYRACHKAFLEYQKGTLTDDMVRSIICMNGMTTPKLMELVVKSALTNQMSQEEIPALIGKFIDITGRIQNENAEIGKKCDDLRKRLAKFRLNNLLIFNKNDFKEAHWGLQNKLILNPETFPDTYKSTITEITELCSKNLYIPRSEMSSGKMCSNCHDTFLRIHGTVNTNIIGFARHSVLCIFCFKQFLFDKREFNELKEQLGQ